MRTDGFLDALRAIKEQVAQLPEYERVAYAKGAIRNVPGLSTDERESIFQLVVLFPTAISSSGPANVNIMNTNSSSPQVTQNASPQVTQNANPQITLAPPAPASPAPAAPSSSSKVTIAVAFIAAAAAITAAVIQSRAPKQGAEAPNSAPLVARDSSRSQNRSADRIRSKAKHERRAPPGQ